MSDKHIALIPAYEPAPILIRILPQLQAAGFQIVVVDDGSGTAYTKLFQKASMYADILTHPVNRGKGCALKTGFTHIQSQFPKDSMIVTVDADGQHCFDDVQKVCGFAEQFPGTLVLGSRRLQGNIPIRSRLGNTVTRFLFQAATGLRIHDTQTGLRAFSADLLPELLEIPGSRYEYEMNTLLEFARKSIPIQEITIQTIYIDNNLNSHFNALLDSFRVYKEILKFSISSFIGFLTDYTIYSLLLLLTGNLLVSNIGARFISAAVNYSLNRRFVFRSNKKFVKSAVQYFLLAAVILIGNTIVLEGLVNVLGIHQMAAKLLTEALFFTISWLVQKCIVFRSSLSK